MLNETTDFHNWIRNLFTKSVEILNSKEDFNNFLKKTNEIRLLAYYHPHMKKLVKIWEDYPMKMEFRMLGKISFGLTFSKEIISYPEEEIKKPCWILYKNFEDKKNYSLIYPNNLNDYDELVNFYFEESVPVISKVNDETLPFILGGDSNLTLILFCNSISEDKEIYSLFKNLALDNKYNESEKNRIIFSIYDNETFLSDHEELGYMFRLNTIFLLFFFKI